MEKNNQQSETHVIKSNKNSIVLAVAVIIVIILVALIPKSKTAAPTTGGASEVSSAETALPEGCTDTTTFSATTGKPCKTAADLSASAATGAASATASSSASGSATSSMMSYAQAQQAYMGRTVQIGNGCVLAPQTQTFKVGTRILLDNASSDAVSVQFQGRTISLRPMHYATSALATAGTFPVSCDGTPNAGSVTAE